MVSTVMVQGKYYEPIEIDDDSDDFDEVNYRDLPVGDNPNGYYDPNAFCRCVDDIIKTGKLHTRSGVLIGRRDADKYYDIDGKLIEE